MRRSLLVAGAVSVAAGSCLGQLHGTVQQRSFTGPITQRPVQFNLYLPEGYATSTQRYPVVYHLHGLGGGPSGHNVVVAASYEAALAAQRIGPVIIVFPNGYSDSWWADSIGGDKPAETDVARQLVPYMDANFRTIPTRGARVVQGFSMGGFGTTKFYSKFPELFSVCVEYDGALLNWAAMQLFQPAQASGIFGNSEAYFDQYSPWHWSEANAGTLGAGHPVRMVVGALVSSNRGFRDYLVGLSIPVDYVEAPCGHDLACLLNTQGLNSATFIGARLDLTIPCYANCDGSTGAPVLNVNDFICFQSRFAAGDPYTNCDGSTAAPVLNVNDFVCFQGQFAAGCG